MRGGLPELHRWVKSLDEKNDLKKHFSRFIEHYDLSRMEIRAPVKRMSKKEQLAARRVTNMPQKKTKKRDAAGPSSA